MEYYEIDYYLDVSQLLTMFINYLIPVIEEILPMIWDLLDSDMYAYMDYPIVGQAGGNRDEELVVYNILNSNVFNIVIVFIGTSSMFGVTGAIWYAWINLAKPYIEEAGW